MSDSGIHLVGPAGSKPKPDAVLDIVFVHGLTGDAAASWTHDNGEFWPNWIAEDFPTTNVYSISYKSSVWTDLVKGSGAGLMDLGAIVLDLIVSRCGAKRPLIFVCHSLGGLIVKQLLRKAEGASNPKKKSVAKRTKAIAFIATPHQGADFAKCVQRIVSPATSKIAKDLSLGADNLLDLGEWFRSWASDAPIEVSAYYELKKYNGVLVVDQMTANPHVHGCDPTAIDADHVSIAKLMDRDAHLYSSVRALLGDALEAISVSPSDTLTPSGWAEEAASEFAALTTQAATDRRSLSDKLSKAGRANEIRRAEAMKERFSMELQRHIAQPSAVSRYAQLLSNVEGRFHRHVVPAVAQGKSVGEVNKIVQELVIDSVVASTAPSDAPATPGQVESAIYFLAGNCHVDWDDA